MACRNSFAGLVMLPGLEISSFFLARACGGREANDSWLSQTADRPSLSRADTLEPRESSTDNPTIFKG